MARDNDGLHRHRPSKVWCFRYRGADGRERHKFSGKTVISEAREFRRDWLAKIASGEETGDDRGQMTLEDALDKFQKRRRAEGLAENTLRSDKECSAALKKRLGGYKLRELTAKRLEEFRNSRISEVSAVTFNLERRVLRAVLIWAKRWQSVEADFRPARNARKSAGRALEPHELEALHAAAMSTPERERIYHAERLAVNAGVRKCELLRAKIGDFDVKTAIFRIRREGTKTDAGAREVFLNDRAIDSACWLLDRAQVCGARDAEHFLFPAFVQGGKSGDCAGLDPTKHQKSFRTAWRAVVRDATARCKSLKGLRFHDLRHHFRSELALHNVDVTVAMELMGHADAETSKIYEHELSAAREKKADAKRRAVAKVGANGEGEKTQSLRPLDWERQTIVRKLLEMFQSSLDGPSHERLEQMGQSRLIQ